jgi:hypothetical protein
MNKNKKYNKKFNLKNMKFMNKDKVIPKDKNSDNIQ